ncbi:MAG: hypothetical protein ACK6DI_18310 [Betaproteobacteria bacterium]|jgi:hypothetical protein
MNLEQMPSANSVRRERDFDDQREENGGNRSAPVRRVRIDGDDG